MQELLYIRNRKESDGYDNSSSLSYPIIHLFSLIRIILSVNI